MSDVLTLRAKQLALKRFQQNRLVAQANVQGREIRIMELLEEQERCKEDIINQTKIIEQMDENIAAQEAEMKKEKS